MTYESRRLAPHPAAWCAGLVLAWGALAGPGPARAQHEGHQMPPAPANGARPATSSEGLRIPHARVSTQDGREVDFFSDLVDGKVVAMNFVFTTCTTICPPMGAIFGRLQQQLAEGPGAEVQLISVSVDPVTDTPDRLKAWAAKFGAADGWTLVTGEKDEIDRLLKSLQVFTPDVLDHSPTVLVGNARTGVWIREYGLAPPARLVELIAEVSRPPAEP